MADVQHFSGVVTPVPTTTTRCGGHVSWGSAPASFDPWGLWWDTDDDTLKVNDDSATYVLSSKRTHTWVIDNPTTGGVLGPKLCQNEKLVRISSYTAAGTSVAFNIEERATIGVVGTNVLSSEMTSVPTGVEAVAPTGFAITSLSADSWLYLDISTVNGTPESVVITIETVLQ